MKTNIFTAAAIVAAMMATSCDDNWTPPASEEGQLDLSSVEVINDDATKLVKSEQSRADIDLTPYIIEVYNAGASTPTKTWTYGTMPEVVTLNQGEYRLDVKSHKVNKAEWEKPYFKGSQTFSITAGKITHVEPVTCKFASVKVTITVADDLKALLSDDATFTVIANDQGELVYSKNETRAGYFEALDGSNTMIVRFSGTIGSGHIEDVFTFTDIEAGQHRDIVFKSKSVPQPELPSGDVTTGGISIDASYTDTDVDGNVTYEEGTINAERPGKEDPKEPVTPVDPDDPTPPVTEEPIRFESTTLDLVGVNNAATHTGDAIVYILCDKGIEHLYVTIDSKTLSPMLSAVNLVPNFDLAEPGQYEGALKELQFKTGDEVKGQTSLEFDISTFVPLLPNFPGDHNFIVNVVDKEGNSRELTLKFNSPE